MTYETTYPPPTRSLPPLIVGEAMLQAWQSGELTITPDTLTIINNVQRVLSPDFCVAPLPSREPVTLQQAIALQRAGQLVVGSAHNQSASLQAAEMPMLLTAGV